MVVLDITGFMETDLTEVSTTGTDMVSITDMVTIREDVVTTGEIHLPLHRSEVISVEIPIDIVQIAAGITPTLPGIEIVLHPGDLLA